MRGLSERKKGDYDGPPLFLLDLSLSTSTLIAAEKESTV